jgi:hypothetical protein
MVTTRMQRLDLPAPTRRDLDKRFDSAGWGLFFVWVAIALLAGFQLGIALLGIGVITLAAQAARWWVGLGPELFWVIVGLAFAIGGLWQLFAAGLPLVPVLLFGVGAALVMGAVRRRTEAGAIVEQDEDLP